MCTCLFDLLLCIRQYLYHLFCLTFHMRQGLAGFMQICETATRTKFSQIIPTILLRQIYVYKKLTKAVGLHECVTPFAETSVSLFPLSFDLYLHPSSFHFDVNFKKARFEACRGGGTRLYSR